MLIINLQNVEEIIFYNKAVQQILPEFYNIFQSWSLGKRLSALKNLSNKAVYDFFEKINDEHIVRLEKHFGVGVKIVETDTHLVKSFDFSLNFSECELDANDFYENWFIWRDSENLYVSSWR